MTSALFNSMFNLGNLMAPIIAGLLNDNYGYKFTTDTMMVMSLFYFAFLVISISGGHKGVPDSNKSV
jgi:predicted MFS family arabinose efflux permease